MINYNKNEPHGPTFIFFIFGGGWRRKVTLIRNQNIERQSANCLPPHGPAFKKLTGLFSKLGWNQIFETKMEKVWKRREWVLLLRCRFQSVIKEFYLRWFRCYRVEPTLESVCSFLFTGHISELLCVLCWCWCPCSYRMNKRIVAVIGTVCSSEFLLLLSWNVGAFSLDLLPVAPILFVALLVKNRGED